MAITINHRLNSLSFSGFCREVYTGATLASLDEPLTGQVKIDQNNLAKLSHDYDGHEQAFFGPTGRYTNLENTTQTFGKILSWTANEFWNWHETPKGRMFGSQTVAAKPESHPQAQEPVSEVAADIQDNPDAADQPAENACQAPFQCIEFSAPHDAVEQGFRDARAGITPAEGSSTSFRLYMEKGGWQQRDYKLQQQYKSTYAQLSQAFSDEWDGIEFADSADHWLPSLNEVFSPPLPGIDAYVTGFNSFKAVCVQLIESQFLKPAMPVWESGFFEGARKYLATWIKGHSLANGLFVGLGRPKFENFGGTVQVGRTDIPDWLAGIETFCKAVGRGVLVAISVPVWALKVVVLGIVANALIFTANLLCRGGVFLLWGLTGVGQAAKFLASGLLEFVKCLAYCVSKLVGLVLTTAAYGLAAVVYPAVAVTAWTGKVIGQALRFFAQNFLVGVYNWFFRPVIWLAECAATLVKAGLMVAGTGIKHALHWAYTKVAKFVSYAASFTYYYMVRPALEYSGKAGLWLVQGVVHFGLAALQVGLYVPGKLAFLYLLKPTWNALVFCADKLFDLACYVGKKLVSACQWLWDHLLLPVGWHAGQFFVAKPILFLAFAIGAPIFFIITMLYHAGYGLGFIATEAGLWLKSQWISKAFYPLPFAAIHREYQAKNNPPPAGYAQLPA